MMDDLDLNTDYLKNRKVSATGRLLTMTHNELASLVTACGGTYVGTPTRSNVIVIVGEGGWPSDRDGSMSCVYDRARKLKAYGYPIEFIEEDEFLDRLGLVRSAGAIRGPHTLGDLSRILDISTIRLRRWLKVGLIRPSEMVFQIPYFQFNQVAFIKRLHELKEHGASLADVRAGMERWDHQLQSVQDLDLLWTSIETDGRLLVRLGDLLLDQSGQQYFDFDATGDAESSHFAAAVQHGFHDLCDTALALEEEGQLEEAASTYRRAVELKPDNPTLHFDLGNVLFQLGRVDDSVMEFQEALRYDPDYAMAWHNLGSVQAQRANWLEAEVSLRRALELVPTYADSHYMLAEVFDALGKPLHSARHREAYEQHSRAHCLLATRRDLLRVVHCDDEERAGG